eukprot:TRINITY_DN1681_c1_g1_i1.p1 TRINITY_DN1681_c1_g1~~TRINITY_DN1681_c1_g1_i1.p1  ORF type:complete len:163 (-),score=40.41 TRINITY_DN1681_c1_g1_i1:143-631(-)
MDEKKRMRLIRMGVNRCLKKKCGWAKPELSNATISVNDDNQYEWKISMNSPQNSIYNGATLNFIVIIPENFPQGQPEILLENQFYHLNVRNFKHYSDKGYQFMYSKKWSYFDENEKTDVGDIFLNIYEMLTEPSVACATSEDIKLEYLNDRETYNEKSINSL